MNSILEHVVNEIWVGLNELIQSLKNLEILLLLLMEQIESDLILVKFHLVDSGLELISLFFNHSFALFDLFLLFL